MTARRSTTVELVLPPFLYHLEYKEILGKELVLSRSTWQLMGSSSSGTHIHTSTLNWQELSKELYDLAAQVKKKRG